MDHCSIQEQLHLQNIFALVWDDSKVSLECQRSFFVPELNPLFDLDLARYMARFKVWTNIVKLKSLDAINCLDKLNQPAIVLEESGRIWSNCISSGRLLWSWNCEFDQAAKVMERQTPPTKVSRLWTNSIGLQKFLDSLSLFSWSYHKSWLIETSCKSPGGEWWRFWVNWIWFKTS